MKHRPLFRQTVFLSCSHFAVRLIGFAMRIELSRELGAAAMGLIELAGSAQMLLITPVISGLPAAVSRMSAKATGDPAKQTRILKCGIFISLAASLPLCAAGFLLREPISLWLGDIRTLPALMITLPCIPVLGVSCALNGYYYGIGRPVPPALGELIEQVVRFFLCMRMAHLFRNWPLTLRAAIPAAGTLSGETVGLLFMLLLCLPAWFRSGTADGSRRSTLAELLALSLPLTGMRIVASLMRTVNATLIPARLQIAGLPQGEALSQLGMMNGMLMPMLMLPSFITCSLCMVCAPELTKRQAQGRPFGSLCRRIVWATLGVGSACTVGLWLFAPLIANMLYRQAELLPLLRLCAPLVPILALSQVVGGMMNGLGLQGHSLRVALLSGLVSVILTYLLAAQPTLRLLGALGAMAVSHLLTLFLSMLALKQTTSRSST